MGAKLIYRKMARLLFGPIPRKTMADTVDPKAKNKLVIAISSRALFDLDQSHQIFKKQGVEAYAKHQEENENVVLPPGVGFSLVKKLLALNTKKKSNRCYFAL